MEQIGKEIRRELDRFGPAAGLGEVVAAWPQAVGPAVAANAWPARIARDGTLHVATSSSAWAFELTQLEATVRERLADQLGAAAPPALRFVPGRLPERGYEPVESPPRTVPEPSPAARAQALEMAGGIDDPALREAVARAVAASLTTPKGDASDQSIW